MRGLAFCIGVLWCVSALASHSYGGLDLCALYPEVMPPGMEPKDLPQPESEGAGLMQSYCTQCHALPGPGRHTAGEWQAVLDKMILLMDVASRFGGLMGRVRVPSSEEGEVLRAYLTDNALQAMRGAPRGMGAAAFAADCGSCHALPDPGLHSQEEWPRVLKRMQRNMTVMKYSPPSQERMVQIQLYLQQNLPDEPDAIPENAQLLSSARAGGSGSGASEFFAGGRWLALGPFLLLALVGVARWWRGRV